MGQRRYQCCACDYDMTNAVERALKEREWGVERVTAGAAEEESQPSVIVTCPLGISLSLAALARMPQPSRFNPNSTLSMRVQLNRIIVLRALALVVAGLLFAAALVLAAFAPLTEAKSKRLASTSLTYSLNEKGSVLGTLVVNGAKRFSGVRLTSATRPTKRKQVLPRITGVTDASGRAKLALKLSRKGLRVVILRGAWILPGGGEKRTAVTIPLRP